MSPIVGGYSIHDIEFVAAFDVDSKKVGKPLNEAVFAEPNKVKWVDSLPSMKDVTVRQSPQLDGVGMYVQKVVKPISERPIDELRKEAMAELKAKNAGFLATDAASAATMVSLPRPRRSLRSGSGNSCSNRRSSASASRPTA